ncbi:MAG: hypothetical protein ACRD0N_03180 [Acidimicrobiales bacterium]
MTTVHTTTAADLAQRTSEGVARIEAEVLALQEAARAALEGQEAPACGCDFYSVNPALHDELLAFEARGAAGVLWLLEYLDQTEDSLPLDGEPRWLSWRDFSETFVPEHNWSDPLVVARLSAYATCGLMRRTDYLMRRAQALEEIGQHQHQHQGPLAPADGAEGQLVVAVEAWADRIEAKLAGAFARIGEPGGGAARLTTSPPADLSPEHIEELVAALPPATMAEIEVTADLAGELAWLVGHVVDRWEAQTDALEAAVGADQVHNGGDLIRAVEGRTRAVVTDEVLEALGLLGSMPPDNRLEVLRRHAVQPRETPPPASRPSKQRPHEDLRP